MSPSNPAPVQPSKLGIAVPQHKVGAIVQQPSPLKIDLNKIQGAGASQAHRLPVMSGTGGMGMGGMEGMGVSMWETSSKRFGSQTSQSGMSHGVGVHVGSWPRLVQSGENVSMCQVTRKPATLKPGSNLDSPFDWP